MKLIRLMLAVALIAAIPAQGLAAVTAGLCMAFGHHESSAAWGHDYHHADGATDHSHAGDSEESGNPAHCGPCVACCAAASIVSPVSVATLAEPDAAVDLPPGLPSPALLPHRLDRPPLAL